LLRRELAWLAGLKALAHPPAGYTWPTTITAESDPANTLVRDSLPNFMRTLHSTPATGYSVGGSRPCDSA
jgi:hypothetical protein